MQSIQVMKGIVYKAPGERHLYVRYSPRVITDESSNRWAEYAAASCICPLVSSQPDLSAVRQQEALFVFVFASSFQQDSPLEVARNESIHQSANLVPMWFCSSLKMLFIISITCSGDKVLFEN